MSGRQASAASNCSQVSTSTSSGRPGFYLRVLQEFASRINHCHGKDTELLPEARYLYGSLPPALTKAPSFSEGAWRYTVPGDGADCAGA